MGSANTADYVCLEDGVYVAVEYMAKATDSQATRVEEASGTYIVYCQDETSCYEQECEGEEISGSDITIAKPVGGLSAENLTPEQITLLAVKETRKRQKLLFKKYGVQMWKNALLPLVQIPLWVTVSMGIRTLTENPLREKLYNNGWLSSVGIDENLYLSEPLEAYPFAVPLVLGTLSMLNVEYNGKVIQGDSAKNLGLKLRADNSRLQLGIQTILNVTRIGTVFMMGFSSQTALLLSLYWISSQLYSLLQNIFLNWLWPYQR